MDLLDKMHKCNYPTISKLVVNGRMLIKVAYHMSITGRVIVLVLVIAELATLVALVRVPN